MKAGYSKQAFHFLIPLVLHLSDVVFTLVGGFQNHLDRNPRTLIHSGLLAWFLIQGNRQAKPGHGSEEVPSQP